MKKKYTTPELIVHGTVEDITQFSTVASIFGYGNGGRGHGGHGGHNTGS